MAKTPDLEKHTQHAGCAFVNSRSSKTVNGFELHQVFLGILVSKMFALLQHSVNDQTRKPVLTGYPWQKSHDYSLLMKR